jgi:thiol-disulfide isomerase/thioredoxin
VPARRTGAFVRSHASRTAAAIACAIAAAFFPSACGPKAPAAAPPAPASGGVVVAVDFDGLQQLLAARGARATVVNCWATWCAPCVAELPDLLAAAAPWKESVEVVLLSYDLMVPNSGLDRVSGVAHVQRFLEQRKLLLGEHVRVVLYDDAVSKLDDRFDLPGPIPTTVVLDRDGKVVGREKSAATRARFDELFGAAAK